MFRTLLAAVAAAALFAGCSDAAKPPATSDAGTKRKPLAERTSTTGRWQLMVAEQAVENPLFLIDISEGDKPGATIVAAPPQVGKTPTIGDVKIDSKTVAMKIEGETFSLSFEGALNDGDIVGTLETSPVAVLPARLIPTVAKSMKDSQPSPLFAFDDFRQLLGGRAEAAPLLEFAHKHPTSPVALYAYEVLINRARDFRFDEPRVREIVDEYEKATARWGKRLGLNARARAALGLVKGQNHPRLALELFEQIEKRIDDPEHPLVKMLVPQKAGAAALLAAEERQKKIEAAAARIEKRGDEDDRKAAAEELVALSKDEELNPFVYDALGRYAQSLDKPDEAIDWYSRLVAVPSLEGLLQNDWAQKEIDRAPPSETLEKVWTARHGNSDGLSSHLDDVFRKRAFFFAKEKVEPRTEEGGRNVLIELFTGSNCGPCVAADVALGGVERTFDRKEVVVLRYHQHIGHDQLCNADGEARFFYYRKGDRDRMGTPMFALNGGRIDGLGGPVFFAPALYTQMRTAVSELLTKKTDLRIELTAEAKDGAIHLRAVATGLPEDAADLRLRVVLAEEEIPYAASNGIRLHEMIVRAIPTTPAGVAPDDDGKLEWSATLPLADFRRTLVDYLAVYEEQNNITFKEKSLALDKLHCVAFLQRDRPGDGNPKGDKDPKEDTPDKEVLQVVSIPVSGSIEYVKDKAPAPPASPEKKPGEDKPEEKKPEEKKPEEKKPEAKPEAKPGADGDK